MKKLYAITLILISLISSTLLLIHFDKQQQKSLLLITIDSYNYSLMIDGFDQIDFDLSTRSMMDTLASKHQVDLVIPYFNSEDDMTKFLFSNNMQDKIVHEFAINKNATLPYATIGENASVQDILHNDRFVYDTLTENQINDFYWNGTIYVSSDNESNIDLFIEDFASEFLLSIDSVHVTIRNYRETGQLLSVSLMGSSIVLFVLLLLSIIQRINTQSTKIGILLLNGYDHQGVFKQLFGADYLCILLSSIMYCLLLVILPDISLHIIVTFIVKDLLLVCVIYMLYYVFIRLILKAKSTVTLLKKSRISARLGKFNMYIQITVTTCIFFVLLLFSGYSRNVLNTRSQIKRYDYLMNYGTITKISSEFLQNHNDLTKEIFTKIKEDELLGSRYIYANFDRYSVYKDGVIVQDGYEYDDLFATISTSYLIQEHLSVFDEYSDPVDVSSLNQEQDIFIFPKIYDHDQEIVLNTYYSGSQTFYQSKSDYHPLILYYDNQFVRTYNLDVLEVDSPVFKIVRSDESRSYAEDSLGLSLYAIGMNTGLKFRVDGDKDLIVEHLLQVFTNVGTPDAMTATNFSTVADYFSHTIEQNYNAIRMLSVGVGVISTILIFSQIQFVALYMIQNNREISVKRYLGFATNDIYRTLYIVSAMSLLVSLLVPGTINFFGSLGDWLLFICFVLLFSLLSMLSLYFVIKVANKNNISNSLKGGKG